MNKITPEHRTHNDAPASLHFLFCNHSLDNYPRILDAIEQAKPDIVAVELVGEDPETRANMENEVNAQLRGDIPNPEVEIGWFEEDLIARFGGTATRYTLVDISSDEWAWEGHLSSMRHLRGYEAAQHDITARRYHAALFLEHSARSMAWREQYTADMLTRLAQGNPNTRIAVVAGMMHTDLGRRVAPGIAMSRQFVTSAAEEALLNQGQKASFNAHEAGRRAYLMGVVSIDEMVAATVDDQGFISGY